MMLLEIRLIRTSLHLNLSQVREAPVKRTRVKKRFSRPAKRRQAKANSQFGEITKSFKRIQVTRRTLPRQYDKDAMKIGKRAEL
jgi:hypothetical protein